MVQVKLKYIWEDTDRHGNVRVYVAVPGQKKVRVRAQPGTPEFMALYKAATDGATTKPSTGDRGSFGFVCKSYYASKVFKKLDGATQSWRRRELDAICQKFGPRPVALLRPEHIRALRDAKETAPGANKRLKALRALFKWAVENRQAPRNPTIEVQQVEAYTEGYHTWTDAEIRKFEKRHEIGTKGRLAMALMLYTTGRREDATRLGPQHVHGDRLVYTQAKNEHRRPVHMNIPLHPELKRILKATPHGEEAFLVTGYGKPFSVAGFGNWFRDRCNEAGLPQCSAHGLRKATAAKLAENGATPHEIKAITGHTTITEVERYTRAANQKRLADTAMEKLLGGRLPPTTPTNR